MEIRPVVREHHLAVLFGVLDLARDTRGDSRRDLDLVMPWAERLDLGDQVVLAAPLNLPRPQRPA